MYKKSFFFSMFVLIFVFLWGESSASSWKMDEVLKHSGTIITKNDIIAARDICRIFAGTTHDVVAIEVINRKEDLFNVYCVDLVNEESDVILMRSTPLEYHFNLMLGAEES